VELGERDAGAGRVDYLKAIESELKALHEQMLVEGRHGTAQGVERSLEVVDKVAVGNALTKERTDGFPLNLTERYETTYWDKMSTLGKPKSQGVNTGRPAFWFDSGGRWRLLDFVTHRRGFFTAIIIVGNMDHHVFASVLENLTLSLQIADRPFVEVPMLAMDNQYSRRLGLEHKAEQALVWPFLAAGYPERQNVQVILETGQLGWVRQMAQLKESGQKAELLVGLMTYEERAVA